MQEPYIFGLLWLVVILLIINAKKIIPMKPDVLNSLGLIGRYVVLMVLLAAGFIVIRDEAIFGFNVGVNSLISAEIIITSAYLLYREIMFARNSSDDSHL